MATSPRNADELELRLQAQRQEMGKTLETLREEVRRRADLAGMIHAHPEWAIAAAWVAGFAGARLLRRRW